MLKFIVSHPAVTCAIPATTRVDHVRENMAAARGRLPDDGDARAHGRACREALMSEWWTYSLSDFLLFSPRTYYRLFELYNAAIWPAQMLALALGLAILALLRRPGRGRAASSPPSSPPAGCGAATREAYHLAAAPGAQRARSRPSEGLGLP